MLICSEVYRPFLGLIINIIFLSMSEKITNLWCDVYVQKNPREAATTDINLNSFEKPGAWSTNVEEYYRDWVPHVETKDKRMPRKRHAIKLTRRSSEHYLSYFDFTYMELIIIIVLLYFIDNEYVDLANLMAGSCAKHYCHQRKARDGRGTMPCC